ncbi:MAG: M1 family aminopeptidase [Chitinophagales bacterium]
MKFIFTTLFCITIICNFAQSAAEACSHHKKSSFNSFQNKSNRDLTELNNYDEKFLKLELEVYNTTTDISGKATHLVEVVATNVTRFVFELHEDLNITNAKVNNIAATVTRFGNEVIVTGSTVYYQDDLVSIEIEYNGTPPSGTGFNSETGIFNDFSPSWGEQVTWTLSEPFSAHTWWPAKQVLSDKIDSTEFIFTTNDNLKVGSNGLLVATENLVSNKIKYTWKSNYPIDYYLVSFAVAPYQEYSYKILAAGSPDSLLIQNFIYDVPGYLAQFENDILETGEMLHLLTEKFGKYPFINEKYGHCIAPLGGGMEHQTMTTQGYFVDWLTVHELGHQWWGNNVTCTSWADIWVNEGFASYSEYIYYQNQSQNAADQDMEARHNNIMSEPDGSLYVYDITDSERIFSSRLTYDKGSAVVHMIRNMINDDQLFYNTLKVIQSTYALNNCNTQNIQDLLLQETGIDFSDFMLSWIYGEGFPTYSGKYNTLNDTLFIEVEQNSSLSGSNPSYTSVLELEIIFEDGSDTLLRFDNNLNTEQYYILTNKEVDEINVDPNNWIINMEGNFLKDENFSFPVISSLNNIQAIDFEITNPFTNSLDLSSLQKENFEVLITTITGEVVYESKKASNQNEFILNTDFWISGVYFLEIFDGKSKVTKKLLKI